MQTITTLLILILPAAVIAYDAVALRWGGPQTTITETIQRWTVMIPELPWLSLALGVWLWCHLYLRDLLARLPPPTQPPVGP
jgi:hypothetical protein